MSINISLTDLTSLTNQTTAISQINNNSAAIETAFGSALNTAGDIMQGQLDLNNNQVLNLPTPATAQSPLRLEDLSSFIGGGTVTNIPSGGTTGQVLTKSSNTNYAVEWTDSLVNPTFTAPVTVNDLGGLSTASMTIYGGTPSVYTTPVVNFIVNTNLSSFGSANTWNGFVTTGGKSGITSNTTGSYNLHSDSYYGAGGTSSDFFVASQSIMHPFYNQTVPLFNIQGRFFSGADNIVISSGMSVSEATGREIDVNTILASGATADRHGLRVVELSTATSNYNATSDTGISIVGANSSVLGFNYALYFGDPNYSSTGTTLPVISSGTLIASQTGSISNGIDFSLSTFSGKAFKSSGFSIDGSGNASVKTLSVSGNASLISTATAAPLNLTISNTGTSSFAGIELDAENSGGSTLGWLISSRGATGGVLQFYSSTAVGGSYSGPWLTLYPTGIVNAVSAGSSSAPSLTVGNSTTGLYSVSTTGLGISVNGVLKQDYGITTSSIWTQVATNFTGTVGMPDGGSWSSTGVSISSNLTFPASALIGPQIYGGSSASSTLTLSSTSVSGSSDAIVFKTGNGVEAARFNTNQMLKLSSANSFSANSSVATVLGSLGPSGSHTTVQTWLTIIDSGGTTRYIPCF